MESKQVQAVAFSLREGEVSDPVEDEDGVHLVKVLKIIPPERNAKGRVICDEVRRLSHIYVEKEPQIIAQTNESMFKDMEQQMQLQAIDRYVEFLRTNGVNRVEYPHGARLFK
jgi:parvulin-like peptidyl-prolyl isomerase